MAYTSDQHGGWKWDSVWGWYYFDEYNQQFVFWDGSADQAAVAADNTKFVARSADCVRQLTLPRIAQGASTYHAYDKPPRREKALSSYTLSLYHSPPSSKASSWSHYTLSTTDEMAYQYQLTMGDPGDDLRAPGDSDNNGGQKGGDMAGGHSHATERNKRSQWQVHSKRRYEVSGSNAGRKSWQTRFMFGLSLTVPLLCLFHLLYTVLHLISIYLLNITTLRYSTIDEHFQVESI